jgi:hypothetical protein
MYSIMLGRPITFGLIDGEARETHVFLYDFRQSVSSVISHYKE